MKRNVILMGGKTHVISLPSQWIKKYQIQKGDELHLQELDNSIVVRTDKHPSSSKELEVDFRALDSMMIRGVGAIYKAGYTRVKILYDTKEQLHKIEQILARTCVGFVITQQNENYVVIESITEEVSQGFENYLKRLFYSLESMNQELVEALLRKDPVLLKAIVDKDDQINRIADFCRRVINSGEQILIDKPHIIYYLVEQLERIGDLYKKIAQLALDKKIVSTPSITAHFSDLNALFVSYRTLFYNFNIPSVEDFGKEFYALRKKIENGTSKEDGLYFPILLYQGYLLETIFDLNGALLTKNI
ncbi:phosphate uptake regulator PhoU [Candidatus Woesearchaeota archaeon]|nr:phosphate uptake regulator PhoU [Candidatus Woesearchaeota archaeon]